MKHFPDIRRMLNEIQRYSVSGKIDVGILSNFDQIRIQDLIDAMKDKGVSALLSVGVPSALGVGVNTYDEKPIKNKTSKEKDSSTS